MSKKLEKELFNIYDVIVFEDENGIAQDCVCVIGKDKEVDEIVDMIECNNHSISIYENGSYKVWEKDGKNKPYYATNKKIIHLYTLKNDNRFYEIYPTNDYESIDNANPSGALESLEKLKGMEISSMPFSDEYGTQEVDLNDIRKVGSQLNTDFREYTATIKQALIKAEKEHNSTNLLMQELDCKDFAELRKYARCGYEKLKSQEKEVVEE